MEQVTGRAPWRTWTPGVRVVVRRRLPAGEPQPYTDVLGDLLAVDDAGVTVRTRRAGDVHVPAAEIALGKIVPPAPVRRIRRTDGDGHDQAPDAQV